MSALHSRKRGSWVKHEAWLARVQAVVELLRHRQARTVAIEKRDRQRLVASTEDRRDCFHDLGAARRREHQFAPGLQATGRDQQVLDGSQIVLVRRPSTMADVQPRRRLSATVSPRAACTACAAPRCVASPRVNTRSGVTLLVPSLSV
jgi:hypothetical protein